MTRRTALQLTAAPLAQRRRPNIIFILGDDVRWDDLGCTGHPFVRTPNIDRIAAEGATFRNAFITTPICSPSRASFLTGQYATVHGIVDNTDRSPASHKLITFPRLLREAGYESAYVGKWHMGLDDSPRPGFDHWVSVRGQGEYFDPQINENGKARRVRGYVTDIFNDYAVKFIERPRQKPFVLYVAHKALHPNVKQNADGSMVPINGGGFTPAPRHARLYEGASLPRRRNYGVAPTDKPALMRKIGGLPPLGPKTGTGDEIVRNRLRLLAAVDEGVGQIFDALRRKGELDNTIMVFAGDNGYFYGEHGLSEERRLAYEESIRIPLLLRYPGEVKPRTAVDGFALNVDVAPTFLDYASAPPMRGINGRSLRPLLEGRAAGWRESFLVEYFSDTVMARVRNMGYNAVRTRRWKYIRYTELKGMDELYDLERDPYELQNLASSAGSRRVLAEMQAEMERLRRAVAAPA
ncbi:MAG: sulfatase [Bryobacteraceae bacterium]